MDLTTLTRVKAHGVITATDTAADTLLSQLITSLSARIIKFIDRKILVKEYTEYFDVHPYQFRFFTKNFPIHSISSIKNDSERDFDNITALLATNYLYKENRGEIIIDGEVMVPGFNALKVVYIGGLALEADDYIALQNAPPSAPSNGDVYIVGASPTGDWAGQANKVATYNGATWDFATQDSYVPTTLPDLANACDIQVSFEYQKRKSLGTSYNAVQSHVNTFNGHDFLPEVLQAITQYKRFYYGSN